MYIMFCVCGMYVTMVTDVHVSLCMHVVAPLAPDAPVAPAVSLKARMA